MNTIHEPSLLRARPKVDFECLDLNFEAVGMKYTFTTEQLAVFEHHIRADERSKGTQHVN